MRILVIGYNAFDVLVPVAGRPEPDSKLDVGRIHLSGGGPGATAAVALARLGADVSLITPLTGDTPGRLQEEELLAAGVDLAHCPRLGDRSSALAVILVDRRAQERTIYWARGDLPLLEAEQVDPAWLHDVDLLYCDGHENPAAVRLARAAQAAGLPVVLDAGSVRHGIRDLVPLCTDVVSSTVFAGQLTGCASPLAALRRLRDLGPERVAMTFGRDGCLGLRDDRPLLVPAFAVPVTDTTGAGDAFHAGYAFARARGDDLRTCLEFGAAVAALKCRGWGGRQTLPELAEVDAFLASADPLPLDALRGRVDAGRPSRDPE